LGGLNEILCLGMVPPLRIDMVQYYTNNAPPSTRSGLLKMLSGSSAHGPCHRKTTGGS
jgi:hypothetical protein